MGEEPDAPSAPETREVESPAEATAARDWVPPTKEFAAFAQSFDGARQGAGDASPDSAARAQPEQAARPSAEPSVAPPHAAVETPRAEEPPSVAGPVGVGAEFETRRDVDDAASDAASDARGRVARVREGTRARVGRMRDEAIVVLEETPDDSGLRFVVAAAALFALFVVLLFLSTTVLR